MVKRAPLADGCLFDVDRDRVGGLTVDGEDHIRLASSTQTEWQFQIHLIEAGVLRLRTGIEYGHVHAADGRNDCAELPDF